MREWIQNIKYSQTGLEGIQILTPVPCDENAKAHKGFLQIVSSLRKQLETMASGPFKEITIDKVVISGHSLGGGLTPLLALMLTNFFPKETFMDTLLDRREAEIEKCQNASQKPFHKDCFELPTRMIQSQASRKRK